MAYTPWNLVDLEVPNTDKWNILGENDVFFNDNQVPLGVIVAWSGDLSQIPEGWALCDGTESRPDFRDRFILGAPAGQEPGTIGGSHTLNLVSAQLPSHNHSASFENALDHNHTGNTDTDGSHSHSGTTTTSGSHTHTIKRYVSGGGISESINPGGASNNGFVNGFIYPASHPNHTVSSSSQSHSHGATNSDTEPNHSHTVTINSAGLGANIDNRPVFATVAFLIKIDSGGGFPYESWSVSIDDEPTEQEFNILGKNDTFFNKSTLNSGLIAFWSGALVDIPSGWSLCDGQSGRPDYRDRFLLGSQTGQNPGLTGGQHSFVMSLNQLPPHVHTATTSSNGSHLHSISTGSKSHNHSASISGHGTHEHNARVILFGSSSDGLYAWTYTNLWTSGYIGSGGSHGHTVNVSNPSHDHDYTTASGGGHSHANLTIGNAGGGGTLEQRTIDNRPAFYKLAIIIKNIPAEVYTPWSVEALEKPATAKWQILGNNDAYLYDLTPVSGLVFIWYGLASVIPAGWALCDGNGGRPDLRDRFILGTSADEEPGGTGGAHSYQLTAYQMAQHKHGGSVGSAAGHNHSGTVANESHDHTVTIVSSGNHSHLVSLPQNPLTSGVFQFITYGNPTGWQSSPVQSAGSHNHSVTLSSSGSTHYHALSVSNAGAHGHTVTVNSTGNGASIDNRPAFRTAHFIMKT